jgi:hypothetical protein
LLQFSWGLKSSRFVPLLSPTILTIAPTFTSNPQTQNISKQTIQLSQHLCFGGWQLEQWRAENACAHGLESLSCETPLKSKKSKSRQTCVLHALQCELTTSFLYEYQLLDGIFHKMTIPWSW